MLGFQKQGTAKVRVQILAAKSRALAVRIKNQVQLAEIGSPIKVKRLPKAKVNAVSLPPPPGAKPGIHVRYVGGRCSPRVTLLGAATGCSGGL